MRIHAFLLIAFALCLVACSKQQPAEPEQPAAEQAAAAEEVAAQQPVFDQAFVDHMHAHAEQLDELMFALADGDLEGAMTPAFWLSRHDAVEGIPEEWQEYVTGMREAAAEIEAASDLETAKAAAERISERCQACHTAAGVNTLNGG
jgi:cytochrome c556